MPKSVPLPISEAGGEPQLPWHRGVSDSCPFSGVWCSWWFSLILLLTAQKREDQQSLWLRYLWRILRSFISLPGYLQSAYWASTWTKLLVFFSVQILHEQTSWLISQTSIAIMPMVVIASLELFASNGENREW